MSNFSRQVLCIGPIGSGKTTLLRKLHDPSQPLTSTIPTTGNNLLALEVSKKQFVDINELGGSMVPIWNMYYTNCAAVMFVIDSSNLQQVSAACILLLEVLNNSMLKDVPVLIVFNKADVKTATTVAEIKSVMLLQQIETFATQKITVLDCSCVSSEGLSEIKNWLAEVVCK